MTTKTIKYTKLVSDGNVLDQTFKDTVRDWMKANMPGFPMGLLDTDNAERWEVQPQLIHTAVLLDVKLWVCPACEDTHTSAEEECCHDDEDRRIPLELQTVKGWAVHNDDSSEYINDSTGYAWSDVTPTNDRTAELDGCTVYLWDDEDEADEAATWCDQAAENYGDVTRHGFPWAHSYVCMPEGFITDDELRAAGFVVATYTGGSGGTYSEEFRLCGIDGGGYDFLSAHYAKLVGLISHNREWEVNTDHGHRVVDMDERSDLERLAATAKEEA